MEYAIGQLQMAEEIGARCCVNVARYMKKASEIDPDMPVIIEHLASDEAYVKSFYLLKN